MMDESHRVDAGGKLRGTPDVAKGLLVEAILLIIDHNRHCPKIPPALIAQMNPLPRKTEEYFIPIAR